jgi:hypothetical protein
MLDEKGAAAALKEAWRKAGYRFVLCNGILSVRAEGRGFQGALENIPVKVLGLITEHFGSFPEDGDAFELRKDEAEQSVMLDQEANWWEQIRGILDNDALTAMKQTPLTMNGYEIWQEQGELKTRMVNPGFTRIVENERRQEAEVRRGNVGTLLWHTMAGTIAYVMAEVPEEGKLDRLDGWPWCGEGCG